MDTNRPDALYLVTVFDEDGEVFMERHFFHELGAKEWSAGFPDRHTVVMHRYAQAPWPKVKRRARGERLDLLRTTVTDLLRAWDMSPECEARGLEASFYDHLAKLRELATHASSKGEP